MKQGRSPRRPEEPSTTAEGINLLIPIWVGIGLVALLLRVLLLDRVPLPSGEAAYSFAAWQASRGQLDGSLVDTGAPLLSYLTTLLFFLLGPSDAGARIVSALAGTALALTPALLSATVGWRAACFAGVLIALSPTAVQLARIDDPASLSALLAMVVVASTVRLLTDRPGWALGLLAVSLGLALVSSAGTVIALGTAAIAALATWNVSRAQLRDGLRGLVSPTARGAWALGALVVVVAGTALFTDLRGLGFAVGDIWGGAARILTPAPLPSRNLGALLIYTGPVLVLALVGFILGARRGDRLVLFLGEWSLLLVAIGAVFGQSTLTLALLPVAPLALLAANALDRLPTRAADYQLSGSAWGVMALALVLAGVATLTIARTAGDARGIPWVGLGVVVVAAALVGFLWNQEVAPTERLSALSLLGGALTLAFAIGMIGRLSFGGSPPGSELLVREETTPELRDAFEPLNIAAMADGSRALVYDATTPVEVRWYGRYIQQVPAERAPASGAIRFREAPPVEPGAGDRAVAGRTPWKVVSSLNRADLNPLGILRWVVTRKGLVEGRARDILVVM